MKIKVLQFLNYLLAGKQGRRACPEGLTGLETQCLVLTVRHLDCVVGGKLLFLLWVSVSAAVSKAARGEARAAPLGTQRPGRPPHAQSLPTVQAAQPCGAPTRGRDLQLGLCPPPCTPPFLTRSLSALHHEEFYAVYVDYLLF